MEPYGEMDRDYYINRNTFLEFLDYDFYNAFLSNGGAGDSQNNVYGGYGLSSLSMSLNNTSPTSSSYLCNLGTQRIKTTAIRIKTQGTCKYCFHRPQVFLFYCHVLLRTSK